MLDKRISAILTFFFILLPGLLVFVVFSHIRPLFAGTADMAGRAVLIAILFAMSMILRRNERLKAYGRILNAFFIASAAMALDYYLPTIKWLLAGLNVSIRSPMGIALDKLDSSVIIVLTILLLNRFTGEDSRSLYLRKGQFRKGLTIGLFAFLVCVAGSLFVARLFGAVNLSLARIVPWTPWILIFIAGNAFNEELLFRGLFLEKAGHISARFWANLAITIPFVLHHTGVTYSGDILLFLAYLVPLSLAWGSIAQDTESLLGSVLFHAGTDIPVVLVIFSELP